MTTLPVGTIISFAGIDLNDLPANWLLCDGRPLAATDYPALSTALSQAFGGDSVNFNLPDLRGMFLRGVSGSTNNDPDASERTAQAAGGNAGNAVGSVQADQFAVHSHALGPGNGYYSNGSYSVYNQGTDTPNATGLSGGSETRPKNVYVYYLIYAGDSSSWLNLIERLFA